MNKLILLAFVSTLLCGAMAEGGKLQGILKNGFDSDLLEKLPPKYRGMVNKFKTKINCGLRCFAEGGQCAVFETEVKNCVEVTMNAIKKATGGRAGVARFGKIAQVVGKRHFVPCIKTVQENADSDAMEACKECLTGCKAA